jgi:hypothetical protein
MQSLDISSVRVLMQALDQIHSTTDLAALPSVLFSSLKELVPDATVTLEELDLKTGVVTSHQSEDCWSTDLKLRLISSEAPSEQRGHRHDRTESLPWTSQCDFSAHSGDAARSAATGIPASMGSAGNDRSTKSSH